MRMVKIFLILCICSLTLLFSNIACALLSITTEDNVTLAGVTLDSSDKSTTGSLDTLTAENDAADGWHIIVSSTDFTKTGDVSKTISATGFDISSVPTVTTISGDDVNKPTAYQGCLAGAGLKLLSAEPGDGIGMYEVTPELSLGIPAETYAGTYTATITETIATGP